jgi:hypothetical protein
VLHTRLNAAHTKQPFSLKQRESTKPNFFERILDGNVSKEITGNYFSLSKLTRLFRDRDYLFQYPSDFFKNYVNNEILSVTLKRRNSKHDLGLGIKL